ncbi:hypothetical protein D9Q98_009257 [Chlorella vulgaris]|uniref:BZIP domain-containing protein n=1 Tax=Chlorella vulgaris TaxID=3077 RepID=A0A9D4TP78_CHLVU|nr:hypothetical protein D9Q98_009257 [Chlorella vulgaris]
MQLGAFTHAGRQAALLSAGPCCSGGDESSGAGKALSEGSSGWSESSVVEQQPGLSWSVQAALQAQGIMRASAPLGLRSDPQDPAQSISAQNNQQRGGRPALAAQLAAGWRQQVQQGPAAAVPAEGLPSWQLLAPPAGLRLTPASNDDMAADWHFGFSRAGSGGAGQQPQTRFQAPPPSAAAGKAFAATACGGGCPAATAAADPWDNGLELVLANASDAPAGGADVSLGLTDAGIDALLAPFEDWPAGSLMQPAPQAAASGALLSGTLGDMHLAAADYAAGPAAAHLCGGNMQQDVAGAAAPWQSAAGAAHSPCSSSPTGVSSDAGADAGAGSGGKAPRRKGGRPRLHYPSAQKAAAGAPADAPADGDASSAPGVQQSYKQSGRGPKPKYIFGTRAEAADARRERNRKAALDSYYKKKEHTKRLQAELSALRSENDALQQLLREMNATGLCPLPEASNDGVNMWLQLNCGTPSAPSSS